MASSGKLTPQLDLDIEPTQASTVDSESQISKSPPATSVQTLSTNAQVINTESINTNGALLPEKFDTFPRLPAEIRFKIWFHALPNGRFIEIDWSGEKWFCPVESLPRPSGLLRANNEFRREFLKFYRPFLQVARDYSRIHYDGLRPIPASVTYFHPKIDTVYICGNSFNFNITAMSMKSLASMECLQDMESMASEFYELWNCLRYDSEYVDSVFISNMKHLKVGFGDLNSSVIDTGEERRPLGEITMQEFGSEELEEDRAGEISNKSTNWLFPGCAQVELPLCTMMRVYREDREMLYDTYVD